jgi:hypothetical protein
MPLVSRTFDQLINFTRTSAATFVGSNGLIQTTPASVNLLTYTQEFDNAAWIKNVGATVAANVAVAPDGTNTADRISFTNDELSRVQQATTSPLLAHAYSIWLRSESGSVTVRFGESGSLTAVTVTETWQRFTVVVTTANPNVTIRNEVAAGIKSVLAWGAQVEVGSVATTYTRNFGGRFPPRFDYDPVSLAPRGLLIEEQRTNLLTYSEAIATGYAPVRATLTSSAGTSPSGTNTATKIVEDTSTNTHIVGGAITSGAVSTFSVYAKAAERTWLYIVSGTATAYYNLATGAVGTTANCTASTVAMPGGWYRCIMSNFTTSTSIYVGPASGNGGAVYAGDGTSGLLLWGLQLEAGVFATSYIPTVASQVTRTSDQPTIAAPNFASWYNSSEGTLVTEYDVIGINTSSEVVATISDGTANNLFLPFVNSGASTFVNVISGGVASANLNAGLVATNTTIKLATVYRANDFAASQNGAVPVVDTAGAVPVGANTLNLGWAAPYGGLFLNGHLRRLTFYPTRLTNAQLQALST